MSHALLNERLLELPLFQGMSKGDIEEVVSSTKFVHRSYAKGKTIINEDDTCDSLYFLIKGTISATSYADDNGYSITETFTAPEIVQPERIFGLTQRYTCTIKSLTDCTFISLGKMETLTLADRYEIFRLNLLNMICTKSQRLTRFPWRTQPKDIRHKIARFVETRCLKPAGEKTVHIKMERLSDEINESRLNVSRELNTMNNEKIIALRRGEIQIFALEKIIKG